MFPSIMRTLPSGMCRRKEESIPAYPMEWDALVMDLCWMWNTISFSVLPCPLWHTLVLLVRVSSMGKIELFIYLRYLKPFNSVQTNNWLQKIFFLQKEMTYASFYGYWRFHWRLVLNFLKSIVQSTGTVEYTDCTSTEGLRPHPNKQRPRYDTKSDGEAPMMPEIRGMQIAITPRSTLFWSGCTYIEACLCVKLNKIAYLCWTELLEIELFLILKLCYVKLNRLK